MKTQQSGFTLIELVVVIVLLGILGVAASAKFIDLTTEAADAAEQGVAGELSSAAAINYAASALNNASAVDIGTTITDCDTAASSLLNQVPADITLNDTGFDSGACGAAGNTVTCDVTHSDGSGTNATATLICTS